ncbi:uncharacterized protein LOC119403645 [Rhipicephalus sanguineus]|uniref:uncharacterized protein LOC119403645 n=1 Tax=Rhipicephalus sanguineus TaxID=34632 RepID=UPI001893D118|nr:uncharacterized protein LOC119403645 [Rhipicephalus sanguineus]
MPENNNVRFLMRGVKEQLFGGFLNAVQEFITEATTIEKKLEMWTRQYNRHLIQDSAVVQAIDSGSQKKVVYNLSSYQPDGPEMAVLNLGLNFNMGPATDTKKLERDAVKRLRENHDIVILPEDKGNATVLLDKSKYIEKMHLLLSDKQTYASAARDPTPKLQRDLQKLLSDIFRMVTPQHKQLYYKLLCHNGSAPAIYGLPKVHKTDISLRPIVDFTRSPLYRLSGFLHRVISPLVGKGASYIRNTYDFIEKVKDTIVDPDEVLVSFDVVSLFTSVPIDMAMDVCVAALDKDPTLPERSPLEVHDLGRLLKFCLSNTYFTFQKKYYRQLHGAAMGASISRQNLDLFTVHLNSMHPAIQFTVEAESEGQLPFLDALVKRDGSGLSFKVFRKPTHTGRYLNYRSVHPASQKRSVVGSLLRRAERVCTTGEDRAGDNALVRQEPMACGYPEYLIDSVGRQLARAVPAQSGPTQKRAAIPYVPGVSEPLARVLRSYDVQAAHVPSRKLRHELVRVKDPLEKERYPGVVLLPGETAQSSMPAAEPVELAGKLVSRR